MDKLPPYLFAEIEKKIQQKESEGMEVISLGIGDPDTPTPDYIVEEMQRQVADPRNHAYPSNAGVREFAEAAAAFYRRRFGVTIDWEQESVTFPCVLRTVSSLTWRLSQRRMLGGRRSCSSVTLITLRPP